MKAIPTKFTKIIERVGYVVIGIIATSAFFLFGVNHTPDGHADVTTTNTSTTTATTATTPQTQTIKFESTTATTTTATTTAEYEIPVFDVGIEDINFYSNSDEDITVRQKYIWDFFVKLGYNEVSVSAIIGNMMVEDPTLTGSNESVSYNDSSDYTDGIIQWDPFSKHREWANENAYDWYDLDGQLMHVHEMLQGSSDWIQSRVDSVSGTTYKDIIDLYPISWEEFPTCNNVAVATVAFERGIEGSHDWNKDKNERRIGLAYEIYDLYAGKN